MMKMQIPNRDLVDLSAYLDGQLTPRERARLEARLQADPGLKGALSELQQTRYALRTIPRMRVQRNFTLTPEMVGQSRRGSPRLYPTFRLASLVASLLFVFVVLGDLFVIGRLSYAPGSDQAAYQVAIVEEGEATPREMVEAPAAPAAEEVGVEAAQSEAFTLEAERSEVVEAEQEDQEADVAAKSVPYQAESEDILPEEVPVGEEEAVAEGEKPALMEAPTQEETREPLVEAAAEEEMGEAELPVEQVIMETPSLGAFPPNDEGVPETGDMENMVDETSPMIAQTETPVESDRVAAATQAAETQVGVRTESRGEPAVGWSTLRIVEVLLGVTALGTGIAALRFRRRG